MNCPICNGNLVKKKLDYIMLAHNLGQFPAESCQRCNESFFTKESSSLIEEHAKKFGLWNLKAITKVNKMGNALAIRFNNKLSSFLKLEKGEEVIIYPESKNKIIIARSKL